MKQCFLNRFWIKVFLCLTISSALLCGCAGQDKKEQEDTGSLVSEYTSYYTFSQLDLMENLREEAIYVDLTEITKELLIEQGGDYWLSGELDGTIRIEAEDEIVHIILDNVSIQSLGGPAINIISAGKVVITLPEETTSIVQDSAYYSTGVEGEACIYSVCDLTINGRGTLQVFGYFKDGIRTKDVLKLKNSSVYVKAKDTGLRGNDGVVVQTNYLELQCERLGVYTENNRKKKKGHIDIGQGNISIIAGEYAIDAAQNVYIHDCQIALLGVIDNIRCQGEYYIEEGCLVQ